MGRRTRRVSSLGYVEHMHRDIMGKIARMALGREVVDFHYDALGRERQAVLPGGGRIQYDFDPAGRLAQRRVFSATARAAVGPGEPEWVGPIAHGVVSDTQYRYSLQVFSKRSSTRASARRDTGTIPWDSSRQDPCPREGGALRLRRGRQPLRHRGRRARVRSRRCPVAAGRDGLHLRRARAPRGKAPLRREPLEVHLETRAPGLGRRARRAPRGVHLRRVLPAAGKAGSLQPRTAACPDSLRLGRSAPASRGACARRVPGRPGGRDANVRFPGWELRPAGAHR